MDLGDTHRKMRQDFEEDEGADSGQQAAEGERDRVAVLEVLPCQLGGIARGTGRSGVGKGHLGTVNDAGFDMHRIFLPV